MTEQRINVHPTCVNDQQRERRTDAVKWLCVRIQNVCALLSVAMRCLALGMAVCLSASVWLIRTLACIDSVRAWREGRQCCMECGYRKSSTRCLRCEGMHHRPRLVLLTFCRH